MPEALISRITSLGPGFGSGNSRSSSFRSPRNTTPFMAASVGCVMDGAGFFDRTRLRDYSPPTWLGHQEFGRMRVTVYELFLHLVAPSDIVIDNFAYDAEGLRLATADAFC